MKKLLTILAASLLAYSCCPTICLSDRDTGKEKEFKINGPVQIYGDTLQFTTKKGTRQTIIGDRYSYRVE